MPSEINEVVQLLRGDPPQQDQAGMTDGQLLGQFIERRDEAAVAALMRRHGPMVWGVCRRLLSHHDAEDAFQATFLVLVRKAASVVPREMVANWLYGVACQTAKRARAMRARRRTRERQGTTMPEPQAPERDPWNDLKPLLDEELSRLPDKYRVALVLCDLEGETRKEAAQRLGLPEGTLAGHLTRGRALLARRLTRRGLALSAGALTAVLTQEAASAAVPDSVMSAALKAVTSAAAGRAAATGALSVEAAALTRGVMTTMFLNRLMKSAGVLLVLAATVGVAGVYTLRMTAAQTPAAQPSSVAGPGSAPGKSDTPAKPAPQDAGRPKAAAVPPPAASAEFDEVTVIITHSFLSNRTRETVQVKADRTCVYEVPGRPARGKTPAWTGARIIHKLPAARLRELNGLLKSTGWLQKAANEKPQLHHDRCEITLKRQGKPTRLVLTGESEPYAKLVTFFRSVAAQEDLIYRLEWVPAAMAQARWDLDNLIAAELGEPFAKPLLAIDLARYIPWATRNVRNPFGKSADDVRTAVRLVGLLKLESERDYLADLASDRNGDVRRAVAQAVGRLGGAKAVPVLRKMLRSTGAEAAWELIKLGPVAVPAIAKEIREGRFVEEDLGYEWLIRAYIEHWKEVPKPLDRRVLDAVRASMAVPDVKAHRTLYHAELLKLAAGTDRKEKAPGPPPPQQ
jgi:RNA polymerase sigma factor (sigma-70 family)